MFIVGMLLFVLMADRLRWPCCRYYQYCYAKPMAWRHWYWLLIGVRACWYGNGYPTVLTIVLIDDQALLLGVVVDTLTTSIDDSVTHCWLPNCYWCSRADWWALFCYTRIVVFAIVVIDPVMIIVTHCWWRAHDATLFDLLTLLRDQVVLVNIGLFIDVVLNIVWHVDTQPFSIDIDCYWYSVVMFVLVHLMTVTWWPLFHCSTTALMTIDIIVWAALLWLVLLIVVRVCVVMTYYSKHQTYGQWWQCVVLPHPSGIFFGVWPCVAAGQWWWRVACYCSVVLYSMACSMAAAYDVMAIISNSSINGYYWPMMIFCCYLWPLLICCCWWHCWCYCWLLTYYCWDAIDSILLFCFAVILLLPNCCWRCYSLLVWRIVGWQWPYWPLPNSLFSDCWPVLVLLLVVFRYYCWGGIVVRVPLTNCWPTNIVVVALWTLLWNDWRLGAWPIVDCCQYWLGLLVLLFHYRPDPLFFDHAHCLYPVLLMLMMAMQLLVIDEWLMWPIAYFCWRVEPVTIVDDGVMYSVLSTVCCCDHCLCCSCTD